MALTTNSGDFDDTMNLGQQFDNAGDPTFFVGGASLGVILRDARGQPPHLGAVLSIGKTSWFTHMATDPAVLSMFRRRRDNQIMGLVLLSISLGLCSFESLLAGKRVVVHSDNTGSESCFRRGTARSLDHALLVRARWLRAGRWGVQGGVTRVARDDNIGDLPSRDGHRLLRAHGAIEVPPVLYPGYQAASAWDVLQERWAL